MIDEKVLNEVLPVPKLEELRDEKIKELQDEGFVITNFASGGIFYHLLMIVLKVRIELINLLRGVLNDIFVSHARGPWLELKSADFSKKRKQSVKTRGKVTISRKDPGEAIKIARGEIFKTIKDINGSELRFFAVHDTVLQKDALTCDVIIEAEKAGADYNVPQGHIIKSLARIEGIDKIENSENWIDREGADIEDYESLRSRDLGAWAELSTQPIAEKYKNVCEGVEGTLFVRVIDDHPRGQGTVDIIVVGTAGEATEGLLSDVRKAAESIRGPYDDLLVKSAEIVEQNIEVIISVPTLIDSTGFEETGAYIIGQALQISKNRDLNELTHSDLNYSLRSRMPDVRNVKVLVPESDMQLDKSKVIIAGKITVKVQKV